MSYSSVCTSAPLTTVASITGRIVGCRTLASIRRTTRPPLWIRPRTGGLSFASVRGPALPPAVDGVRAAPFYDIGRPALVAGHDVDLVDLDLALQPRRREPGGEPLPQLLGHELRVGLAQ